MTILNLRPAVDSKMGGANKGAILQSWLRRLSVHSLDFRGLCYIQKPCHMVGTLLYYRQGRQAPGLLGQVDWR